MSGAGSLNSHPDAVYSNNTNAGTPSASYTYAGDDNHTGSSDSKTFAIDKAASTTAVTNQTREIAGVTCVVVNDTGFTNNKATEKTSDYYAQDNQGNVWYYGEDSFELVKGKWVRSNGSWLAGVDGAQPGIIMEAHPKVGDVYRQEYSPGHAEDMAEVLSTNASVSVPYGSFDHALQTKEWTPLEPGVVDNKYYAAGIGEVEAVNVEGGDELMELVSVTGGE